MFDFFKKKPTTQGTASRTIPITTATPPAGGCKTCKTANGSDCNNHLGFAAPIIAQQFKNAGHIFDPNSPAHIKAVETLLGCMEDNRGQPIGLVMPTDPTIRANFLRQIATAQPR